MSHEIDLLRCEQPEDIGDHIGNDSLLPMGSCREAFRLVKIKSKEVIEAVFVMD
ncbi:MAG: hypothetical protein JW950_08635 [Deltaproteobacteria bacterium]|nr:hypothetical protein [Deltaproteobacteria bacterium]